jgi:hypothetical protein
VAFLNQYGLESSSSSICSYTSASEIGALFDLKIFPLIFLFLLLLYFVYDTINKFVIFIIEWYII